MKKLAVALSALIASSAIISCGNKGGASPYPDYNEKGEGLYVKSITDNTGGRTVAVGDIISLNMSYSINNDSTLYDTELVGQPAQMKADSAKFDGDFMGSFIGMKEGDSVSIIVDANSFFTKTFEMPQSPDYIDSADVLYFSIGVAKVQTEEEIQAEAQALNEKAEAEEQGILESFLSENNITTAPTASGMYYIPSKEGTGKQAEAGKKVKVHYEGKLLDGTYFDTSVEEVAKAQGLYDERRAPYTPFEFDLGIGKVIRGWDEGIALMKEGGKATFIIPSNLAYGSREFPGGIIKPFSTLVFDVELIEVIDAQ